MSMDDLYRQDILDHSSNPRNFGTLDHPDISAEDSNPLCGDKIRMDLRVRDGTIEDVRFTGGLKTELKSGDQVSIIPAIAGG